MARAKIGIIGGSGVYDLPDLEDVREQRVESPFGTPSDAFKIGRIGEVEAVFLARHGRGHVLSPSGINYRANIDAFKRLGVTDLISVSACGSFREHLYPGMFVLVDQFIDRTHGRESSFFGDGCVAHVSMAKPVAPQLVEAIAEAARATEAPLHRGGTYVCMEGPQFSTYAESMAYKNAGCDVIGMTACPEVKLAREAEISYAAIAMVTDYDCWRADHEAVQVADIVKIMRSNALKAGRLLAHLIAHTPLERAPCPIGSDRALDHALLTAPDARDPKVLARLDAILARLDAKGDETCAPPAISD